ncbi:MAG: proline racemase family protein [Clostridia bacterium]
MNVRDVLHVVDLHAGGEPLRVIVDGYPPIPGRTILERRAYLETHLDHLRKRLMWEPWGHEDMYGCLILPPERDTSDFGLIFMHNAGYSTMCGHATIAVTRFLVETGRVPWDGQSPEVVIRYDVPSGEVTSHAVMEVNDGRVTSVWFENVPAWALALDETVSVGGRRITYDVGYGGAFYALVEAGALGLRVEPAAVPELKETARQIRDAIHADHAQHAGHALVHPLEPRIRGLYGVIFTEPPKDPRHQARHVTVFADREVDRSPCGSCVSARMAVEHAHGRLPVGTAYAVESVLDTVFTGEVLGEGPAVGQHRTVRTRISGMAYLVGFRRFYVDPGDPLPPFLIR